MGSGKLWHSIKKGRHSGHLNFTIIKICCVGRDGNYRYLLVFGNRLPQNVKFRSGVTRFVQKQILIGTIHEAKVSSTLIHVNIDGRIHGQDLVKRFCDK